MTRVCMMSSVHPPFDPRIFHKQCRSLVDNEYEVIWVVPAKQGGVIEGIRLRPVRPPRNRWARVTTTVARL